MKINVYKAFVGAFIPNWLMCRKEISQGAKLCYARLCQYAGKDGLCYPTEDSLGEELGVSSRQVRSYLQELKEKKLLTSEKRNGRMYYYFNRHEFMACKLEGQPEEKIDTEKVTGSELPCGSKLPPLPEEDFRNDRKNTSAKENQEEIQENITARESSNIQKLIKVYKQLIGIPADDKDWDKPNFPRCAKAAKEILKVYEDDALSAAKFLIAFSEDMKKKELSWTIFTAHRKVFEYKYGGKNGKT